LVRRLLVVCVWAAIAFAVIAGVQGKSSEAAAATSNLKVTAAPPAGCPLGAGFTFCNALVGGTTSQSVFTVTNASSATVTNVTFSLAALPGQTATFNAADFTASTTCGASLAANATCTVTVAFTPTATGLRQAALAVKDTQGDSTTIFLAGTGSNLAIAPTATPAGCTQNNAFTFCNTLPGGLGTTSQFTLASKNAVTGVTIALAAVPGLASEFTANDFTETSSCGVALGPGTTCPINIQFTPTVASKGARAALMTVTDAQGDSVQIYLAGLVSSAGNTTSNLTITPASAPATCAFANSFGFCNVPIGGSSASSVFTLTNTSGSAVTGVTIPFPVIPTPPAVAVPTDFTVKGSACASTLAAHATCTINIAFTPTATGSRQGSVVVTDAQGDQGVVNLTGFGDDYQLQLAAGQPVEVTVMPGSTATFKGQVVSDGTFGAQGEQVSFGCPDTLPALTTCAFSPCPVSVTPGTPAAFSIVFVTSSATVTALPPTSGACPGSANAMLIFAPKAPRGTPSVAATFAAPLSVRGGAFAPLAAGIGMVAIFASGFFGLARRRQRNVRVAVVAEFRPRNQRRQRAVGFIAFATLIGAVLAGCHHKTNTTVVGTPNGATTMVIQGQALDASGNALSTSRPMPQIILDVETK
jgi:hypothetical protein